MKKIIIFLCLLSTINYQLSTILLAQPPRVKYKDMSTVDRSPFSEEKTKGAPADVTQPFRVDSEEIEPQVKITLIPKKLSPHFSEFQVEGEINNAEITRISFRLFGKLSGAVNLEVKEIDFSTEGLDEKIIFYRGYDFRQNVGGIKGIKIYFRVAKNWLSEKNFSPEKVSLNYYAKGEISPLITEKISEDENYYHYLSKTDRLGIFLIFTEKL